jgi:hypothetical protein
MRPALLSPGVLLVQVLLQSAAPQLSARACSQCLHRIFVWPGIAFPTQGQTCYACAAQCSFVHALCVLLLLLGCLYTKRGIDCSLGLIRSACADVTDRQSLLQNKQACFRVNRCCCVQGFSASNECYIVQRWITRMQLVQQESCVLFVCLSTCCTQSMYE